MRIALTVYIALVAFLGWTQTPSQLESLNQLYPEHDLVFLKDYNQVTIAHHPEKGVKILMTTQRQIYLSNDRAGLYKDDYIFSSFFQKMIKKDAYALNKVKDKDKYEKKKVTNYKTTETISEEFFFDDGVATSFSYDGLKKGSILNLEYTQELTQPYLSISGFFSSSYPILDKSLAISVEDGIDLSTVYFNMDSTDVNYSKTRSKNKTIFNWQADTLDVYKKEISSPSQNYFVPHLMSRIRFYQDKKGNKVGVLENVQDLYNWYFSLINQVKCESTLGLEKIIEEIISAQDTELEKVKKVFKWVQANVKYIAIEDGLGGFIPRDPSLVMSRRYGDCKDMATLIVQLLDLQGIKAYQTWIGTNELPYKYEEIPSPAIDNHMIAAYFDQESNAYLFLDATDDQLPFGYPSSFIQGKEALINVDGKYEIVEVPILSADKTTMLDHAVVKIASDSLVGSGNVSLTGYYATDTKHVLNRVDNELSKKSFIESMTKKGSNKYQLDNYKISLEENATRVAYSFSVPDYVNRTDKEIYVNLNLDLLISFFAPYEVKDRKNPIMEKYASQTGYEFTLEVPKGYSVNYLPQNLFVDGGNDFYLKINYNTDEQGNIKYSFDLYLNYIMWEASRVEEIKELGKKMKNAYKETIILKKI